MSSEIRNINDFVRKAAERKKELDEKRHNSSKSEVLEKAVQKKKILDEGMRHKDNSRLFFAVKLSAAIALLAICALLASYYAGYYRSQTGDSQLCYTKKPDVLGKLSRTIEYSLRGGGETLIPENLEGAERVRISEIFGRIAGSQFELCRVGRLAPQAGTAGDDIFEVGCLTPAEKITFRVSYAGDSCKVIGADCISHKNPIDL